MNDWTKEFGRRFAVPDIVGNVLVDVSYGNDSAPSFCFRRMTEAELAIGEIVIPRLWVNHPDPERRDFPGENRYQVTILDEMIWEGGDVTTAMTVLGSVQRAYDVLVGKEAAHIKTGA